jgi:hypothetical protein
MKTLIRIVFVAALLLVPSAYAQQRQLVQEDSRTEKRIALVIGNSAYVNAPPLKNPVKDAQDMRQVLRGVGFDVIYRENLNQNDMKRAIREFGTKIRNGGVGLFYYAGHGVAVKGINYLVPVDAEVEREEEIEYECVDAGFVLSQMENAGNRLNIVILDACRNNPFARSFRAGSRGLAQMDAPSGTLIAFATAPGSVASDGNTRNGIYTQELLRFMQTPSLGLEEVFKQVRISVRNLTQNKQTPWELSSVTGDFYFSSINNKEASNVQPSRPAIDPIAVELAYWETIKNSSHPEDFSSYLEKYPNGQFAALARRRAESTSNKPINRIDSGSASLSSTENQNVEIRGISCYLAGVHLIGSKSSLSIHGSGWNGESDVKVFVNGQKINAPIDYQDRGIISLKGTNEELNLLDGKNEVAISVNGIASNTYVFRQAIK